MEPSNKFLAFLVLLSIGFSLFSVFTFLGRLNELNQLAQKETLTGKATSGTGKVNLTVESTMSIVLRGLTTMDFGSGYVNTSCPFATYANLSVTDSGYTDQGDCWTSQSGTMPNEPIQPFRIENDGNQNVTLTISCPHPDSFFSGYAGSNLRNLSFKARSNESNSCPAGSLTSLWTACSGTAQTLCSATSFKYTPDTNDEIAVDFNIVIPDGLASTTYMNDSITFRAQ